MSSIFVRAGGEVVTLLARTIANEQWGGGLKPGPAESPSARRALDRSQTCAPLTKGGQVSRCARLSLNWRIRIVGGVGSVIVASEYSFGGKSRRLFASGGSARTSTLTLVSSVPYGFEESSRSQRLFSLEVAQVYGNVDDLLRARQVCASYAARL